MAGLMDSLQSAPMGGTSLSPAEVQQLQLLMSMINGPQMPQSSQPARMPSPPSGGGMGGGQAPTMPSAGSNPLASLTPTAISNAKGLFTGGSNGTGLFGSSGPIFGPNAPLGASTTADPMADAYGVWATPGPASSAGPAGALETGGGVGDAAMGPDLLSLYASSMPSTAAMSTADIAAAGGIDAAVGAGATDAAAAALGSGAIDATTAAAAGMSADDIAAALAAVLAM